ncbi:MAG TPA: GNAT family N-acetyltransferase [Candidatus Limnocylindrales bacterium]|nr:GNAT family N-acetyltransferase [Candidatus Limnocylindrales bacterium]
MVTRVPDGIDADTLRFLEIHEARVHAIPGREVRDLGDAVLLRDRIDREPFWNRVVGIRWPDRQDAFDRRVAEIIALFGGLDRIPHIWPLPMLNQPADLVERLRGHGFLDVGGGITLVLADADSGVAALAERLPPGVTLERLDDTAPDARSQTAADLALVLTESFDVESDRRAAVELETLAMFEHREVHAVLIRVDGEPAAAAKRATFDNATYISSVGTRPAFRGRGLARIATAAVTADAARTDCRWTYLAVLQGNDAAIRLYERLGFARIGGIAPDLILA